MYTEENQRGRFPLRDILLKAIVVIIFLILIIFIITKVTAPANMEQSSSNYDKVFNEQLKNMEKAAFIYYTKDKLPKEIGEVKEVTLREMINSNLLAAFTDANGDACDVDDSYIRLTKNDDDYTLRINLKCNKKEDYSLMKVGEYDYCEHDICKKDSSKEKKSESEEDVKEQVESSDDEVNNNSTSDESAIDNSINNNASSNSSNFDNSVNNIKLYEYKKVTNAVLSDWSSWSSWDYNNNRYSAIKCSDTDTNCLKEIQLYSRKEKIGTKDGKAVYATVNYYSYRTRSIISNGSVDIKWSTYNDSNLLNQGYSYTGNYK